MQNEIVPMQHRHDVKRQIDEMHQPRPDANRHHQRERVFHIDPQQRQERHKEMAEDYHQPDIPPGPLFPDHIPKRLFRHVAVPNDEILRKSHVGVKHREGEHERPENQRPAA